MDRAFPLRFLSLRLRFLLALGTLAVVATAGTARAQTLEIVGPDTVTVGQVFAVQVQVTDAAGDPDLDFNPDVVLTLIGRG